MRTVVGSNGKFLPASITFRDAPPPHSLRAKGGRNALSGGTLVAAMNRRYPDASMGVALQIGAKVAKAK
ncbi:hypothetical protein [Xylophilus sp. Leaf220]|uniref:hypothetical protein n=1 Tax=Xylophilus sp. Leaf220 TaxID=1735686 RepID=UPI001F41FDDB|nr:hypothetical protein [Xylophilus sp. Leaf220]